MLKTILAANRRGEHKGVYAVCSVNRHAIRAALRQARRDRWPVLIEATAQQVNPAGGYSGMTPADFAGLVYREAAAVDLDPGGVMLGGDHVGLRPWAHLPAGAAMGQALRLVKALVAGGFAKLHIDATTPVGDDPREPDGSLPMEYIISRTVDLMTAAESAAQRQGVRPPLYVVGSDVPAPGGATGAAGMGAISMSAQIEDVLAATRNALAHRNLTALWPRIVAIVARTGADFSSRTVQPYEVARTRQLAAFIETHPGLVYEAHSTDFQTRPSLQAMVANHFAILKVGPWLTYTFRDTVYRLAGIERELLGARKTVQLSHLAETLEAAMTDDPQHWQQHYRGSADDLKWLRVHAYSDRIRYYWTYPGPAAALQRLFANLRRFPPPDGLIEAHLPAAYPAVAAGGLAPEPEALIDHQLAAVIDTYAAACGCPA
jgi:D-tagatose-1,6-bisphosphate aldolase subunit GatZ/KbaZ